MNVDLIELAESKGFLSTLMFAFNSEVFPLPTEKEVQEFEELKWYLWMCELQRWLREVYKIELWLGRDSIYNNYQCTGDLDDSRGDVATYFHKTYEEALEKGLKEALNLI